MGPIIGVGVGALHLVGAAVVIVVPVWLGITYLTARTVYRRSSMKRLREAEELANRLEALVRELAEIPPRLKP
jgi:Flp pilus assembly protein TadB